MRSGGRGSSPLRVLVPLGTLALLAGVGYGAYRYLRIERPKYSLPADDPRCPHGMIYVRGGQGHLLEDKLVAASRQYPPVQRVLDVKMAPFCLDANEVTVEDYTRCVNAGKCAVPEKKYAPVPMYARCNYGNPTRVNHPINGITWNDAKTFCATEGKRLPLEDEWEYAAQGGEAHYDHPWGSDHEADRACLEKWTHQDGTCAVRSYPPEAFGLFDMSANVQEYTQFSCAGKPCDAEPDDLNVPVSGGSWSCGEEEGEGCEEKMTRENSRGLAGRNEPTEFTGFRCAK